MKKNKRFLAQVRLDNGHGLCLVVNTDKRSKAIYEAERLAGTICQAFREDLPDDTDPSRIVGTTVKVI